MNEKGDVFDADTKKTLIILFQYETKRLRNLTKPTTSRPKIVHWFSICFVVKPLMSGEENWKKECNSFSRCFQAVNWLITVWEPCFYKYQAKIEKNYQSIKRLLAHRDGAYNPAQQKCLYYYSNLILLMRNPLGPGVHSSQTVALLTEQLPHPKLNCSSTENIQTLWYLFYILYKIYNIYYYISGQSWPNG